MRRPPWILLIAGLATGSCAAMALAQSREPLRSMLASTPAESLQAPLRQAEADRARGAERAEAAMPLGRLHSARSEYREAAAAFARAAARLEPGRKDEARYWAGISWLGVGEPVQARAALEEVVSGSSDRRVDATLGLAQAWELARRPERALAALEPLAQAPLGEAGPAVLERLAMLAEAGSKPALARHARERLLEEYPRSIEAASVRLTLVPAAPATGSGAFAVVIGTFIDKARAGALASEARRAGFPQAQVVTRGSGLTTVHIVRLGTFPSSTLARRSGEQATQALGVTYEIVRAP